MLGRVASFNNVVVSTLSVNLTVVLVSPIQY